MEKHEARPAGAAPGATESEAQRRPSLGDAAIPRLHTLLRLLPPGSSERARLRRVYHQLADADPRPPLYTYKHLARYLATIRHLRGVATPGIRWLDLASDVWFAWLCRLELGVGQTISTGLDAEDLELRVPGAPPFRYRQVPLELTASTTDLGFGDDHDLVSAFELVEHLQFHPAPFFKAVNAALRLGGRLVLSTPNIASWASIVRLLDGTTPHLTPLYGGPMDHRKEYTIGEMRQVIAAAGFAVEQVTTFDCYEHDRASRLQRLGAIAYSALTLQARRVRNLVSRGGSTMLIRARKVGPCDLDALARIRV